MFLALNAKRIQTHDLASNILNKNIRQSQDKHRISCISSSLHEDSSGNLFKCPLPGPSKTEPKTFQISSLNCSLLPLVLSSRLSEKTAVFGVEFGKEPTWISSVCGWVVKEPRFLGTKQSYHYFYPTTNISKTGYSSTISSLSCC